MSNGRNSGCRTVVPALSVSVSVSVPVSVVCFGDCGRCLFRYLFRFRHRSQAQARITETGTETGTDYRHGLQARITETGTETGTDYRHGLQARITGTDHRDRNRHGSQRQKPAPKQKKLSRAVPTKNQKAQQQLPPGLSGYDYASVHSAGCGAADLALPPAAFTPALSEILIM